MILGIITQERGVDMEFQKAIQAIRQGKISPVITVYGTEYFLQQEFVHTVLKQFGDEETLDLTRIDLEEQSIDAVLDEAEMFSFFAENRIIIADNATFLAAQTKQKLTEAQQARLIDYLNNPNEMSVILFLVSLEQLDKRKKITKLFQQQTHFVEVTTMTNQATTQYVQSYLENSGIEITRDALYELLVRVNYQLTSAMNEVSKLQNYNGKVTLEVIKSLVPRTLESDVFELTKAVLHRQVDRAVGVYRDLILLKHEQVALHALIVSQFRLMIQAKLMSRQGYLEGDIASKLSVHPYRVKLALQEASQYELKQLTNLYNELIEVDFQMKTGVGVREAHFDLLLVKIATRT